MGLFLKLVISDNIAVVINPVFFSWQDYSGLQIALAVILFAFQIYGDFGSYSPICCWSFQHAFTTQNNHLYSGWFRLAVFRNAWFIICFRNDPPCCYATGNSRTFNLSSLKLFPDIRTFAVILCSLFVLLWIDTILYQAKISITALFFRQSSLNQWGHRPPHTAIDLWSGTMAVLCQQIILRPHSDHINIMKHTKLRIFHAFYLPLPWSLPDMTYRYNKAV